MPQTAKTFRIFVSSTFSDLKAERDALQRYVFPRLRDLCLAHGTRFQAIDLRWGVSEEAALDQQTMTICLGEIERCQQVTPRPNFIVLLGERYGWEPLPEEIPADEFEHILLNVIPEERALLCWDEEKLDGGGGWYRRDDNAVPPLYILQPREGGFEDYRTWTSQVERPLLGILRRAIEGLDLAPEKRLKYEASATHQEIERGAMQLEDAHEHVFGFFRWFTDLDELTSDCGHAPAQAYLDLDPEGQFDSSAHGRLESLKEALSQRLGPNVHEFEACWTGEEITKDHIGTLPEDWAACEAMLADGYQPQNLCETVWRALALVILAECEELEEKSTLQLETEAHAVFGQERARFFVGRAEILRSVADYLTSSNRQPLAVWGEAGSGKSALMARAVEQAHAAHPEAQEVYRFVGATPDSSSGRALLESLCRQISVAYAGDASDIPLEYSDLVSEFPKRLALATADKPLFVFIDALDQLSDTDNARNLVWLPKELPAHVRLVVSTLPGECLDALKWQVPDDHRMELEPMPAVEGKRLLEDWLVSASRTLQPNQRAEVLGEFSRCGLPLYLRLAFEEARRWHSYDGIPDLGADIPGIIEDLFARLADEKNHGQMLVSRSLGYLAAAQNGLTEDELLDVLARDVDLYAWFLHSIFHMPPNLLRQAWEYLEGEQGEAVDEEAAVGWLNALRQEGNEGQLRTFLSTVLTAGDGLHLPMVLWARLYRDLEPYLAEYGVPGGTVLNFYHRQVGEHVREQFLSSPPTRRTRHQRLAEYFHHQDYFLESQEGQRVRALRLPPTPRSVNLRKVDELPWQELQAAKLSGKWDQVRELFTDLHFFEAKAEAGLAFGLAQDLHDVLTAIPREHPDRHILALLEEALRRDVQFIANYPTTLFQCMWNACWWYDCSELADHFGEQSNVLPTRPTRSAARTHEDLADRGGVDQRELAQELEKWKNSKDRATPGFVWLRSLRPPADRLGEHLKAIYRGHTERVTDVDWSPKGDLLVSCGGGPDGRDRTIRFWDVVSGSEKARLLGHEEAVNCVRFRPDGQLVASGSDDGTIRLWSSQALQEITVLCGQSGPISGLEWNANGNGMFSYSQGIVKLWRQDNDRWQAERIVSLPLRVTCIAVHPNGSILAVGTGNGIVKLWDLRSGKSLGNLKGHTEDVASMSWCEDGKMLVSGSHDGTIRVWDTSRHQATVTIRNPGAAVTGVHTNSAGLIASCDWHGVVRIWDLVTGHEIVRHSGHRLEALAVRWNPWGDSVASAGRDGTVRVWTDGTDRNIIPFLQEHSGEVLDLAWSTDASTLATAGSDGIIKLWDASTGIWLGNLGGGELPLRCLAWQPGTTVLAFGGMGTGDHNPIKLWDARTQKLLVTLPGHRRWVTGLTWDADGRYLTSESLTASKRWDISTGQCVSRESKDPLWEMIAPEKPAGSWSAVMAAGYTTIVLRRRPELALHYPYPLSRFEVSSSGRLFAGVGGVGTSVHMLKLEGDLSDYMPG